MPRVGIRAAQWYFLVLVVACTCAGAAIVWPASSGLSHALVTVPVLGLVVVRIVEYRRGGPLPWPADLVELAVLAVVVGVEGVQPARAIFFAALMYRAVIAGLPRVISIQIGYVAIMIIGVVVSGDGTSGLAADVLGLTLVPYTFFLLRSLLQAGERERERHHRLLDTLVQNVPIGIVVCDLDGRTRLLNRAVRRILGWPDTRADSGSAENSSDGVPGSELLPLIDIDGLAVVGSDHPVTRAVAGQSACEGEYGLRTVGGEQRRVVVNPKPIIDAAGEQIGVVIAVDDVTQQRHQQDQLTRLALYDGLTGLPNRHLVTRRLGDELATDRRHDLAVLAVRLDRFKTVQETLGHQAADDLVMVAASRIAESVAESDTVARVGSDEFAVLLPHAGSERAGETAARIIARLDQPIWSGDHPVRCTVSVGIATPDEFDNDSAERADDLADAETLLRNADLALFDAHSSGGDRIHRHTDQLRTALQQRIQLESDLYEAVGGGQLRVFYQPIIDLATGRTRAVEALVRWEHPIQGMVLPDRFIPLAESNGLITDIGRWVLEHAARQLATAAVPEGPVDVSVNVAAVQLRDPLFGQNVLDILRATGLPADRLILEITESADIEDGPARAILDDLRSHGVRIAIDDFGTGYSSLARLGSLPADILKIDRSLLRHVDRNSTLLDTAVTLAHSLGLKATAEGVETLDQADHLRRHGCDSVQGYLYARPSPWSELFPADAAVLLDR